MLAELLPLVHSENPEQGHTIVWAVLHWAFAEAHYNTTVETCYVLATDLLKDMACDYYCLNLCYLT